MPLTIARIRDKLNVDVAVQNVHKQRLRRSRSSKNLEKTLAENYVESVWKSVPQAALEVRL